MYYSCLNILLLSKGIQRRDPSDVTSNPHPYDPHSKNAVMPPFLSYLVFYYDIVTNYSHTSNTDISIISINSFSHYSIFPLEC